MLAYSIPADNVDDYVQISVSIAIKSLKRSVTVVVKVFGDEYLKSPNINDLTRLLTKDEKDGFPVILGSIDYMHWT